MDKNAEALARYAAEFRIETKFRTLTADTLEPAQTDAILAMLWRLEELADVGEVLELFAVKTKGTR